jgi:hypothetical protein
MDDNDASLLAELLTRRRNKSDVCHRWFVVLRRPEPRHTEAVTEQIPIVRRRGRAVGARAAA